jgi:hypothetical protein
MPRPKPREEARVWLEFANDDGPAGADAPLSQPACYGALSS